MKKTILALTIASSVVLLTGCDAEDDAVKYYGSEINNPTEASEYASNVRMLNELVLENVITNCNQKDQNYCQFSNSIEDQNTNHYLDGKVKLSHDTNGKVTIETYNGGLVKLKDDNNKIEITATFSNDSNNHHKIAFKRNSTTSSEYTVTFNGQYQDHKGDNFQSHSIDNKDFIYDTTSNKFISQSEKATLKGKKHTPSWTWNINNNSVVVQKDQ